MKGKYTNKMLTLTDEEKVKLKLLLKLKYKYHYTIGTEFEPISLFFKKLSLKNKSLDYMIKGSINLIQQVDRKGLLGYSNLLSSNEVLKGTLLNLETFLIHLYESIYYKYLKKTISKLIRIHLKKKSLSSNEIDFHFKKYFEFRFENLKNILRTKTWDEILKTELKPKRVKYKNPKFEFKDFCYLLNFYPKVNELNSFKKINSKLKEVANTIFQKIIPLDLYLEMLFLNPMLNEKDKFKKINFNLNILERKEVINVLNEIRKNY